MCFGGDDSGTSVQNVTSRQITELPEYVKKGGEETFAAAKPLSERAYPLYSEPRIAGFTPDTINSFQMVRDASGAWKPAFDAGMAATAAGATPVNEADIAAFMNPYTQAVIDPAVADIQRRANTDTILRNAKLAKRGSYLTEDRRAAIDSMNKEATDRTIANMVAQLKYGGYNQAVTAAQAGKEQKLKGAAMYSTLAPQAQSLALQGAAGVAGVGETQQAMEQQGLNLKYQDFLAQFGYPQEQINWLISVLGGVPYSKDVTTAGQQIVPVPNSFAQNLGATGAFAGGLGMLLKK